MTDEQKTIAISNKQNEAADLSNKIEILSQIKVDFESVKGSNFRSFSLRTELQSITLNSYVKTSPYIDVINDFIDKVSPSIDEEIKTISEYISKINSEIEVLQNTNN